MRTVLELLFFLVAIPDGKPLRTFPGIAVLPWSQFRTENRFALFLELLFFLGRNSGRKTSSHFLELLSGQM
ncbi:hypothetical protein [Mesorhizobium sp.]|uniref:hypothetical protein n=1 Tax=Mesorhizobium sp. TaxID=1871066 RepID=UPI0025EDB527|nr:hypothetical protein [Mesorhizobium sp.]